MSPIRGAFSMAEIVIAMGITAMLVTLTITYYDGMTGDIKVNAARSEIDEIRNDILRQQMERRTDFAAQRPPATAEGRDRHDPWGQPYRVDPNLRQIWSTGPNTQDERGGGDDIAVTYDAYGATDIHPPTGFRVVDQGGDWVELGWNPVRVTGGITGYNVYRRESVSKTEFTTVPQNPQPIADVTHPVFRDAGLSVGTVYYYKLDVIAKDGTTVSAPSPLGFTIPVTAPPHISVSPPTSGANVGQTLSFTITATAYGAAIRTITFDGDSFDVNASTKSVVVTRKFSTAGTTTLAAGAVDSNGRHCAASVVVEVH